MPIRYRCTHCGLLLSVGTRMAGRQLDCPQCQRPSEVPAVSLPEGPLPGGPFPGEAAPLPEVAAQPSPKEAKPAAGAMAPDRFDGKQEASREAEAPLPPLEFRKRELSQEEMDLTPMVDMTFLLLIFFMVTASFTVQKSIDFPAPSPEGKGATQTTFTLDELEERSIMVRIDERNVIFVDDEPLPDLLRLSDVLRQALSTRRNEMVVSADDRAFHETVVAVIDAANEVGMQKIRMASGGAE
jgi:biopolymer transport protein ExbD